MFFLNDADKMVPRVFGFLFASCLFLIVRVRGPHDQKNETRRARAQRKKKREERERSASRQKKNSPRVSITQARARDLNKKRDRYTNTQ
jgi:Flp pilus assembly protein TadB